MSDRPKRADAPPERPSGVPPLLDAPAASKEVEGWLTIDDEERVEWEALRPFGRGHNDDYRSGFRAMYDEATAQRVARMEAEARALESFNEAMELRMKLFGLLDDDGCPAYGMERGICDPIACDCGANDADTHEDFEEWCVERVTALRLRVAELEGLVNAARNAKHLDDHTELRPCPLCVALTDLYGAVAPPSQEGVEG